MKRFEEKVEREKKSPNIRKFSSMKIMDDEILVKFIMIFGKNMLKYIRKIFSFSPWFSLVFLRINKKKLIEAFN